jgi:hypothetical protein
MCPHNCHPRHQYSSTDTQFMPRSCHLTLKTNLSKNHVSDVDFRRGSSYRRTRRPSPHGPKKVAEIFACIDPDEGGSDGEYETAA